MPRTRSMTAALRGTASKSNSIRALDSAIPSPIIASNGPDIGSNTPNEEPAAVCAVSIPGDPCPAPSQPRRVNHSRPQRVPAKRVPNRDSVSTSTIFPQRESESFSHHSDGTSERPPDLVQQGHQFYPSPVHMLRERGAEELTTAAESPSEGYGKSRSNGFGGLPRSSLTLHPAIWHSDRTDAQPTTHAFSTMTLAVPSNALQTEWQITTPASAAVPSFIKPNEFIELPYTKVTRRKEIFRYEDPTKKKGPPVWKEIDPNYMEKLMAQKLIWEPPPKPPRPPKRNHNEMGWILCRMREDPALPKLVWYLGQLHNKYVNITWLILSGPHAGVIRYFRNFDIMPFSLSAVQALRAKGQHVDTELKLTEEELANKSSSYAIDLAVQSATKLTAL